MTGKKFLVYWFLSLAIFTFLKIWFFNVEILSNAGLQQIVFWILMGMVAAALARRFGVISFLEALFIMTVWSLSALLVDFILTSHYTGLSIFQSSEYWFGLLAMNAAIFLFHKKRHLAVRKELHDLAHAKSHEHKH